MVPAPGEVSAGQIPQDCPQELPQLSVEQLVAQIHSPVTVPKVPLEHVAVGEPPTPAVHPEGQVAVLELPLVVPGIVDPQPPLPTGRPAQGAVPPQDPVTVDQTPCEHVAVG